MYQSVIFNKTQTIQRCIKRINEDEFKQNYAKQDSVILNLIRASRAAIDMATHIIKVKKLGIPNSSREVFEILENNNIISKETSHNMQAMVGFRNIAVHDYQNLSLDIVLSIIENHLKDFTKFNEEILGDGV